MGLAPTPAQLPATAHVATADGGRPEHGPRTHPGSTARHSARGTGSLQTLPWRKADSNSRSHFSARATLSLFATSRFEWDLCATYRSEPILLPIPPECARRVVVVTVLRGPHRGLAGYAITGFFELDEAALVECALTSCPVLKGLPTFGAPHRRAAHDPFRTIAGAGTQEFIVCPRSLLG
jgi:hypothetical protein